MTLLTLLTEDPVLRTSNWVRGNGSTALGEGRPPPATRPTRTAYWQVGRYSTHLQKEGHEPRTLYSGGSALSYSARPLTTDSLIAVLACQYFQADSTSPNLVWRVPRCRLLSTGTPACKEGTVGRGRGGCKGQAGQLARADKASFFSYLLHHRSQKSPLDEPSLFPSSLDGLWRAKKYVQLCLLFSTE